MPQRRVGAGAASKQPAWEGDEGRVGRGRFGVAGSRGARAAKVERGAKEHGQPAVVWRGATAEAEAGFVSQLGCSVWLTGCGESCGTHAGGALSFHSD